MRVQSNEWGTKIKASENDTYAWAHRAGAAWPCSDLSGHRVFAELDLRGDLVDLLIDGKFEQSDIDIHELNGSSRM